MGYYTLPLSFFMIVFIPVQIIFITGEKHPPNPVKLTIEHDRTLELFSGKHGKHSAQRRHLPFYWFEIKESIFSVWIKLGGSFFSVFQELGLTRTESIGKKNRMLIDLCV